MKILLEHSFVNDYYIELLQVDSHYEVEAFQKHGELYGYPIKSNSYADVKKALRYFRDIERKAKKAEL